MPPMISMLPSPNCRSIRRTFYVEEVGNRVYKVTFTPQSRGKHRVYVYLNGMEVKGSPFSLRIGKDVREKRTLGTDIYRWGRKNGKGTDFKT